MNNLKNFLAGIGIVVLSLILIDGAQAQAEDNWYSARYSSEELQSAPVKLIPYPQHVNWESGKTDLTAITVKDADTVSKDLLQELSKICSEKGIRITDKSEYSVRFLNKPDKKQEEYILEASNAGIEITASTETGAFYALQTLYQLILKNSKGGSVQHCYIKDFPAYKIRGYMIDVGRNFQSIASLKKQLDLLARYKMNTFHWHLTDRPAWRIESKIYPQLTAKENHREGRNPGKFYTYAEIRDLFKYAKQKKITIIPEIDMPGHSDSFTKAMGFKMESKKGIVALKNILKEFFEEVPVEMAPMIHIGSDEVRIPKPQKFIDTMADFVESHDRKVIIWSPGLKGKKSIVRQTWGGAEREKESGYLEIDSRKSYINAGEPMSIINTLFFRPIGYGSENTVLGGITCFWPDVNLKSEEDAFKQNPVYPSLLTFAWATWTAGIENSSESYFLRLPPSNEEAFFCFAAFEEYLLEHKKRFFADEPFPYLRQTDKHWKLIGPFKGNDGDKLVLAKDSPEYSYKGEKRKWIPAVGNTLVIRQRWMRGGYFPDLKAGNSVYAATYIYSNEQREIEAWINFETAMRANRVYAGIPENGKWDNNGGTIWLNDKILPGPNWDNPGWKTARQSGWGNKKEQEIPWAEEELYWTRKPAKLKLNKGWNKVMVKIPGKTDFQNWMFTFVPLDMTGLRFSIDPEL